MDSERERERVQSTEQRGVQRAVGAEVLGEYEELEDQGKFFISFSMYFSFYLDLNFHRYFHNSSSSPPPKSCTGITRFENGPYSLLLMENVSLTSSESTIDYWQTPFLDSEVTVYAECQGFAPSRLFKPFLKQVQHTSITDLEKKCTVRSHFVDVDLLSLKKKF